MHVEHDYEEEESGIFHDNLRDGPRTILAMRTLLEYTALNYEAPAPSRSLYDACTRKVL